MVDKQWDSIREKNLDELKQALRKKETRLVKISYASAFRNWVLCWETLFDEIAQVLTIEDLLDDSPLKEKTHNSQIWSILKKIVIFLVGKIPVIGNAISDLDALIDIARNAHEVYLGKNDLQLLKGKLKLRASRARKRRKLRYILNVSSYEDLSVERQRYIGFLSYLIENNYLTSTALVIGTNLKTQLPMKVDKAISIDYPSKIHQLSDLENNQLSHAKEILEVIGIEHIELVRNAFTELSPNAPSVQQVIQLLIAEAITDRSVDKDEFGRFLKLCSFLFEPFLQKDIEGVYHPLEGKTPVELVECAIKSKLWLCHDANLSYSFIEYFIRDFYRENHAYAFSDTTYQQLFLYLRENYPYQYTDIALLSAYLKRPDEEIVSYCIVAWYHECNTIPQRKQGDLRKLLKSFACGSEYLALLEIVADLSRIDKDTVMSSAYDALQYVKSEKLSAEASLCFLNIISAAFFEIKNPRDSVWEEILDEYFQIFAALKIVTHRDVYYVDYIADVLLLSAGIEPPTFYKNKLDRLAEIITPRYISSRKKRLRLLRLGNVIFSPSKGHRFTKEAFEQSTGYDYEHILAAINYSASLLCRSEYDAAYNILKMERKLGKSLEDNDACQRFGKIIVASFFNNFLIAKANHSKIRKQSREELCKEFKELTKAVATYASDGVIVENNYIAALIWSEENRNYALARRKLKQIIDKSGDEYHKFFSIHNLLVLLCLQQDQEGFRTVFQHLKIPYLLRKYEDYFFEKFHILSCNIERCRSLVEMKQLLLGLAEKYPDLDTEFYRSPILWGVIERWFE